LDYFLALAGNAGKFLTCKEISEIAERAASVASLGQILCRIRKVLRPAVEKYSGKLLGVSKREIELAFIVCSPGNLHKGKPTRYKLAIDPGRVHIVD
jgi:hypothetical protein